MSNLDASNPTVPAAPVPGDSRAVDLGETRDALLAAYRELLRQVHAVASDPRRADEAARLADAAGRLVDGSFAVRLVFG